LARDIEQSHRPNSDASDAKPINIFPPAQTQRSNNACAGDDYACRRIGTLFRWKEHGSFGYFGEA
jgi:hypothetical protein